MKEINCDKALKAKMAQIDGEEISISRGQINLHLKNCQNCRKNLGQLHSMDILLKQMERKEQSADLWKKVEAQIEKEEKLSIDWKPFVVVGVILVAYKLVEMLPDESFGLAFKFVPLVFVIALFVFLKENPFKINEELLPEN